MSSPCVKVIDKQSIHQLCSGQVVVTLATAVKELVENSLDAGASNIEVRLKNWGAESLEVIDNGSGVLHENFAALTLKHHTSKLNVYADLVGVETFGFRGEALSSLCALGNLSIITCHKSDTIGAKIEYNHAGHIIKQTAAARMPGTTVTISNLFSTLPVRYKEFLRNIKREYAKMMQVLQGYCVISIGVRITCYTIDDKGKKSLVLKTHGNSELRENISNVFGPKQLQSIIPFKQIIPASDDCEDLGIEMPSHHEENVFNLTGFVSRTDHGIGRSASDRQYVFINKRPCDMHKLMRLVNEVYHMFNRHQYPFVVLNIELNKELIDVNVTPDKRQVFVQQEKLLFATVKSSLKAMYNTDVKNYETNQEPLSQMKLLSTTEGASDGRSSEYVKSIKDRLEIAARSIENMPSILKYTTTTSSGKKRKVDNVNSDIALKSEERSVVMSNVDDSKNISDKASVTSKQYKLDKNNENICDEVNKGIMSHIGIKASNELEERQYENYVCQEAEVTSGDQHDIIQFPEETKVTHDISQDISTLKHRSKRERLDGDEDNDTRHFTVKRIKTDEKCFIETGGQNILTVNFDFEKLRERHSMKRSARERMEDDDNLGGTRSFRALISPENNDKAEEELQRHITKDMFNKMKIVGQFNQGFIIVKLQQDLFIVDQHASDEKYNFEQQQQNTVLKSQRLIVPQSLDLTAVNESVLLENLPVFKKNGFDFEVDENAPITERVKLLSTPVIRNWSFDKHDIDELIFMLSNGSGGNCRPSNVRKMFASRACRMSVMIGTTLNEGQMRKIVCHMGEMDQPWNCPHGRPTMRHLINLNMIRK